MKYRYAENSNNNKNLEKNYCQVRLLFQCYDSHSEILGCKNSSGSLTVSETGNYFYFTAFKAVRIRSCCSFQSCLDLYQKPLFTRINLENQGQIQTWLFLLNCTNYSQYFMNLVVTISGGSMHKFPNQFGIWIYSNFSVNFLYQKQAIKDK